MSRRNLIAKAEEAFERLGVNKSAPEVMETGDLRTGRYMDETAVESLIDMTVAEGGWLAATTVRGVSDRRGEIPKGTISEVVTEPSGENEAPTSTGKLTTSHVAYDTRKYVARFYLTLEDMQEAEASGDADFETTVEAMFGKAMGNDMARAALNGDESITTPTTKLERLLAHNDGWLAKIRAAGRRYASLRGTPYARGVFSRAIAMMADQYADDPDLRWLLPRALDLAWSEDLRTTGTPDGLLERGLVQRQREPVYGIPQIIAPQMRTDLGFSVLRGSAVAADAVADSSGNVLATVDALFGGYSAANDGRKVKITHLATGTSQVATVFTSGGASKILTVGSLGQATISTVAADYALDVADATSLLLTNPKNLGIMLYRQIRAYRVFEEDFDRYKFLVRYEMDPIVFEPDAAVLIDGIVPPSFEDWA